MGEKLLAQRLLALLHANVRRQSREAAVLMEWALEQRDWLWPDRDWQDAPAPAAENTPFDWDDLGRLTGEVQAAEADPVLAGCLEAVAGLMELDLFERDVLRSTAMLERHPCLMQLRTKLLGIGVDLANVIGRLAGATQTDASARVRRSLPLTLGLIQMSADSCTGALELSLSWRFSRVLDSGLVGEESLIAALAGIRQEALLRPEDFAERREDFDLLVRLLEGALRTRAQGINLLIHGPPGTGKTELARTLAAAAGASLFAVGEIDEDGDEPTRAERVHALKRAQRLLARRGGSILLFDEMEDLFSEASFAADGGRRAGSKIFVNRLLEQGRVPVIWTSNEIDAVDPAHLRRMSFVLRMNHPSAKARARIIAHAAHAEGVADGAKELVSLLPAEAETASIARVAVRTAALAGGRAEDAQAAARSLLLGLRGGRTLPPHLAASGLDLGLYEAEQPIAPLLEQLVEPGAASDFSLLLTGPPGTGKTALAAHLAERLDRPLRVKRASDLLSKWVGGTEARIAEAFAEAQDEGAVLLFDEADSLLLDRADAQRSWEITQVNELLTWMDSHPLPFVAATNFAQRLDPAALRRFVFKIELRPLSAEAAERAYESFFGMPAPADLSCVRGLTPGDFAVVKRQLRYRPHAETAEILALLEVEVRAKPERPVKIGF